MGPTSTSANSSGPSGSSAFSSPFAFFERLAREASGRLQPPGWLVEEVQHRGVLLLNHVLQQEPEALARLARQKGRVVKAQWRSFHAQLIVTPAGLLDLAPPGGLADLTLSVAEESPFGLARAAVRGEKPAVRIEGDVQLAAEINWLADNVRWDIEDDLARVIGEMPAHQVARVARTAVDALKRFVAARGQAGGVGASPPAAASYGER